MRKTILSLLLFIISLSFCYSQCTISIMSDNAEVDTMEISLGDSIVLYAITNCGGASNEIVNWSTGQTVLDPPPMYPTQTCYITSYVMNILNGDFAIDTVHIIVKPSSSIEDNKTTKSITIFPNPTKNLVYISNKDCVIIKEINIYNHIGKNILHKLPPINSINISDLSSGLYIIEFVCNDYFIREKLIVE